MAKGKKHRTPKKKEGQKIRTAKNQARRYKKLLEERPNDPHASLWKKYV